MTTNDRTRTIETEMLIEAPVEQVWQALTDPDELVRWFPKEARVTPGKDGEIFLGWGPEIEGSSRILEWDPGRSLKTMWFERAGPTEDSPPLVVDYTFEGRGGKTLLRLVHSGFGAGASWDEEYEGTRRGWAFELRSLRHYLERHRGKTRRIVWSHVPVTLTDDDVMARLWSAEGLLKAGNRPQGNEGDSFGFTMATGDRLDGKIFYALPDGRFAGTVETMQDGLFRVMVDLCGGQREAWLWLSTWDLPEERVAAIEQSWTGLLKGLVG